MEGQADGRMERWTEVKQYTPLRWRRGITRGSLEPVIANYFSN